MGKNGVTVNGILHTPSSAPQQLYTQDFLQVGEQKFFFLLPKGTSRSARLCCCHQQGHVTDDRCWHSVIHNTLEVTDAVNAAGEDPRVQVLLCKFLCCCSLFASTFVWSMLHGCSYLPVR